jgi:hypothetical protein
VLYTPLNKTGLLYQNALVGVIIDLLPYHILILAAMLAGEGLELADAPAVQGQGGLDSFFLLKMYN